MEIKSDPSHSDGLDLRKRDHIELTTEAQTLALQVDQRFHYEPLFFSHPGPDLSWPTDFLGAKLQYPIWISSMTGGTREALDINQNLARLCGKYRLGMGLGSCRALLSGAERLADFAVRRYLGDQPFYANLGIAQVEECLRSGSEFKIHDLVKRLEASGLVIHLNPLQEWFQPEGDRFVEAPVNTIRRFLDKVSYPVLVKEVGQGMGPRSLEVLLGLNIAGIEFAAFGGTNFTLLESLRGNSDQARLPFIKVGHTAAEMVEFINGLPASGKSFIISGGMSNVLDGYYLKMKLQHSSVIGMASGFLEPARHSFESTEYYFLRLRESLMTARGLLSLKEQI